jgi:aspartate aminotransferase-like enzyme
VNNPAREPLLLMTPGPTRVPDRVLRAGARPMIHHRTPEFSRELGDMVEGLKPFFGTTQPVLPLHTTGRGGLEAAICNFFSAGDAIAVCCNGKFGEMWADFAESYGLRVTRIATDWERNVDPAAVDAALADDRAIKAVALPYGDTSTGVANDVRAVARVAAARGVLTMADGVSSIGGMPFAFDEWGVDVAVSASQKCFMSSPGLSFVAVSERAWPAYERAKIPRNYFDLGAVRDELDKAKPETPGTSPVHLVLQVAEALRMLHEEGIRAVFARHARMAELARAGAAALGLAPQCPQLNARSTTLTAIALPPDLPPQRLREGIKARGILTAAGLDRFKDSAFRIGHMGDIREADVSRTLAAVAEVIAEMRVKGADRSHAVKQQA